jgi:nicotinamidase-related amidase
MSDALAALKVLDMQNDFGHLDGSLFVAGGDSIVDSINDEIERIAANGDTDTPTGLAGLLRKRGTEHAGFAATVLWDATRPMNPDVNVVGTPS